MEGKRALFCIQQERKKQTSFTWLLFLVVKIIQHRLFMSYNSKLRLILSGESFFMCKQTVVPISDDTNRNFFIPYIFYNLISISRYPSPLRSRQKSQPQRLGYILGIYFLHCLANKHDDDVIAWKEPRERIIHFNHLRSVLAKTAQKTPTRAERQVEPVDFLRASSVTMKLYGHRKV